MKGWYVARVAVLLLLLGGALGLPAAALSPSQVLVVYNDSELPPPEDPEYPAAARLIAASKGTANYYREKRCIPQENLIGLTHTPLRCFGISAKHGFY